MTRLRAHLTYANVVATLALFIALAGGTAFAAKQLLPKNSVGTKQIKNNSITGAKVKDGAITGAKLALSSLGTVPSAARADSATRAGTATSAETAATAADAQALQGMSPAQIAAPAKLTCPADTTLVAGVCIEKTVRPAATWLVAARTCAKAGRLLPTTAQVAAADYALKPPTTLWTDTVYFNGPNAVGFHFSITDNGYGTGTTPIETGSQIEYLCVVPPGN